MKGTGSLGRMAGACSVLLVAFFSLIASSSAQPTVTLSVQALEGGRQILFTLLQPDLASMEGCHYNLFAAASRPALATLPGRGLSIATFYRAAAEVQLVAAPLGRLQRASRRSRTTRALHFRTLLSCPTATNGLGDIVTLAIPTTRNGRYASVGRLLRAMKNHMQYADTTAGGIFALSTRPTQAP